MIARFLLAIAAMLTFAVSPARAEPASAQAVADRLVAAMGGVAAWSSAQSLTIKARHWEAGLAEPYDNLIQMSFIEPRMRFEGDNTTMKRRRGIVGDTGWRVSELSPLSPMTPEQVAADRRWWDAHAYRTVGRLARKDPAFQLKLAADGRLEVHEAGKRLVWYRVNAVGEPIAYGAYDDERGTIFGPLADRPGGVRLPQWVTSASGEFRAVFLHAAASAQPSTADFAKP